MSQTPFEQKVLQHTLFEMPLAEPLPNMNPYARQFAQDCEELVADLKDNLNELTVHVALLQLQRKYFMWFETVPPDHRDQIGDGSGQTHIHHVYVYYYRIMDRHRIALNPPLWRDPPPPRPAPQFASSILGLEA